jgi:hypothetical protein
VRPRRIDASYSVVIGGVRVLITGDDLRSHPIRGAYECVSPSNCPVQLSTNTKINYERKRKEEKVEQN